MCDKYTDLRKRIQEAINCTNAESGSNTPDFILATYLVDCLRVFDKVMVARSTTCRTEQPASPLDGIVPVKKPFPGVLGKLAVEEKEPCRTEVVYEKCKKCDGCGLVATTDEEEPWTHWQNLPKESQGPMNLGLVRSMQCPECKGKGQRYQEV